VVSLLAPRCNAEKNNPCDLVWADAPAGVEAVAESAAARSGHADGMANGEGVKEASAVRL
jgi:hypothetical protein